MAESSPTPELPKVEDIDPEGDVIISCPAQEHPEEWGFYRSRWPARRMKVSSKTLCQMSKPFNAMLSPRFREGRVERSKDDPLALELPDDISDAVRILLHVAHLSPLPSSVEVTAFFLRETLEPLVIVADKYDCLFVVHAQCVQWARKISTSYNRHADLEIGAKVGFLLNDAGLFNHTTKTLLGYWTGSFEELKSQCLRELLYRKLVAQSKCKARLNNMVEESIVRARKGEVNWTIPTATCRFCRQRVDNKKCCSYFGVEPLSGQGKSTLSSPESCTQFSRNDAHLGLLFDMGLYPPSKIFGQSLKESLKGKDALDYQRPHECEGGGECTIKHCRRFLKRRLEEMRLDMEASQELTLSEFKKLRSESTQAWS